MKDPILEEELETIIRFSQTIPSKQREDFLLGAIHDLVNPLGDLWIYGVIAELHLSIPGHLKDPAIIAVMEMLEGALTIRRLMRG